MLSLSLLTTVNTETLNRTYFYGTAQGKTVRISKAKYNTIERMAFQFSALYQKSFKRNKVNFIRYDKIARLDCSQEYFEKVIALPV